MYHLEVMHLGQSVPVKRRSVTQASEVLEIIPRLLAEHPGCEQVVVWFDLSRLFAVDCAGNRISD